MIVVAYPGTWEEALGITFMHAGDKPIRVVYLVNPEGDSEELENDALLLCPTVPFATSHEIAVRLEDTCSTCGGSFHRAVRREDVGESLREKLIKQFGVAIHFVNSVTIRELSTQVLLTVDNRTVRTNQVIVLSKAATWRWSRLSGVSLSVQTSYSGGHVSNWKGSPVVEGSTLVISPYGKVSAIDDGVLEWVLSSRERFIFRLTSSSSHSKDAISKALRRNGWPAMRIKPCTRSRKWTLRGWILSRFTRVALVSFLKRWLMMYLQTWVRVAAAVFIAARTQFFSPYVTYFAVELAVSWFFIRVRYNGLLRTLISLSHFLLTAFERSEARVRSSTQSKFFSFTLAFTLFQLLLAEAVKFIWSRVERWWTGKRPVITPVVSNVVSKRSDSSKVDIVLLDTETSFAQANFSRFVLEYWKAK